MFQRVSKRSLAAAVFEQLRDRIVAGELRAGDPLPAERVLCEQLGVNRNAVREGLKRLEQAGLVSIRQGDASRVRDFRRTAGLELLGAMVVTPSGTVNTAVARSIVEMRSALAPELGRLCAARADAETIRALQAVVKRMRAAGSDLPLLQRLALEFWATVVRGARNLAFELAFNALARTYSEIQDHLINVLRPEISATDDYARLAEAVAARDRRLAARRAEAIVAHGARAVARVLDALDAAQKGRKR